MSWSPEDVRRLRSLTSQIRSTDIDRDELKAMVEWLQKNKEDAKSYPKSRLYDRKSGRHDPEETDILMVGGRRVMKSKDWVYKRLVSNFKLGELDWVLHEEPVLEGNSETSTPETEVGRAVDSTAVPEGPQGQHEMALVRAVQSPALMDLLLVGPPDEDLDFGPGSVTIENAQSSLTVWDANELRKRAHQHSPKHGCWELANAVRQMMDQYSAGMKELRDNAVEMAWTESGLEPEQEDAAASGVFSDSYWQVPLCWAIRQSLGSVGGPEPFATASLIHGQEQVDNAHAGGYSLWCQPVYSPWPIAAVHEHAGIQRALELFNRSGRQWLGDKRIVPVIKIYWELQPLVERLRSSLLALTPEDMGAGHCTGCPGTENDRSAKGGARGFDD